MNKGINNPGFRSLPQSVQQNILSNMKYGGRMYNTGGMLDEYNEGGTHEENPLGGIPIGQGPNGQPNLVEQGETRFNDYIFSNRLEITKDIAQEFNLPKNYVGKTFSDASKSMQKSNSRRVDDKIEQANIERNLTKLQEAQEVFKQAEIAKKLEEINELDPNALAAIAGQGQGQGQPSMAPQQPSPEEMMMMEQAAMQQGQMAGQPMMEGPMEGMAAYGGPLSNIAFGMGGNMYSNGGYAGDPPPFFGTYGGFDDTPIPSLSPINEFEGPVNTAGPTNLTTNFIPAAQRDQAEYLNNQLNLNNQNQGFLPYQTQRQITALSPEYTDYIREKEIQADFNKMQSNMRAMGGNCYGCGGRMYASGGQFVPGRGFVLSEDNSDNLVGAGIVGGLKGATAMIPGVGGYVSQGIDSVYKAIDPTLSEKEKQAMGYTQGVTSLSGLITGNVPGAITSSIAGFNQGIQNSNISDETKNILGGVAQASNAVMPLFGQGKSLGPNTPINVVEGTNYIDLPNSFPDGGYLEKLKASRQPQSGPLTETAQGVYDSYFGNRIPIPAIPQKLDYYDQNLLRDDLLPLAFDENTRIIDPNDSYDVALPTRNYYRRYENDVYRKDLMNYYDQQAGSTPVSFKGPYSPTLRVENQYFKGQEPGRLNKSLSDIRLKMQDDPINTRYVNLEEFAMGGTMGKGLSAYYDVDGMGGYLGSRNFFSNGGDLNPPNKYLVRTNQNGDMIEETYQVGDLQFNNVRKTTDPPLTEIDVIAKYEEVQGTPYSADSFINNNNPLATSSNTKTSILDPDTQYIDLPEDETITEEIPDSEIPALNTGEDLTEEEKKVARENYARKQALDMAKINLKYKESLPAFALSMAPSMYNLYQGLSRPDQMSLGDLYSGDLEPELVDYTTSRNIARDIAAGVRKDLKGRTQGGNYAANLQRNAGILSESISKIDELEKNTNSKIKNEVEALNKKREEEAKKQIELYNRMTKSVQAAHLGEALTGLKNKIETDAANNLAMQKLKIFAPDIAGELEYKTILDQLGSYTAGLFKKNKKEG